MTALATRAFVIWDHDDYHDDEEDQQPVHATFLCLLTVDTRIRSGANREWAEHGHGLSTHSLPGRPPRSSARPDRPASFGLYQAPRRASFRSVMVSTADGSTKATSSPVWKLAGVGRNDRPLPPDSSKPFTTPVSGSK